MGENVMWGIRPAGEEVIYFTCRTNNPGEDFASSTMRSVRSLLCVCCLNLEQLSFSRLLNHMGIDSNCIERSCSILDVLNIELFSTFWVRRIWGAQELERGIDKI